ncbi:hypothetical protein C8Q75DRAFT_90503 [Abortiporus biennis]|nr:hypothetical protein C8Q75DRAFT_90503 [Abortiporus biennis]
MLMIHVGRCCKVSVVVYLCARLYYFNTFYFHFAHGPLERSLSWPSLESHEEIGPFAVILFCFCSFPPSCSMLSYLCILLRAHQGGHSFVWSPFASSGKMCSCCIDSGIVVHRCLGSFCTLFFLTL